MQITRRAAVAALGLALVLGGTSCSKVADKAAEKATEKAIEGSSDCEDVDLSGDGATVTCDGNTYDYSGEGNASLPEGWPSEVELPDGASILASSSTTDPVTYHVTASVSGEVQDVYDAVESQLTGAGFTIDTETAPTAEVPVGGLQASGSDLEASVSLSGDGSGEVTLAYTLSEVAP